MLYTYRFRLSPTEKQEELIQKHFGCSRFLYNHYLSKRMKHYEDNKEDKSIKSMNYYSCANDLISLKKEYERLSECNSQSLQVSLRNLDNAYQRFFKQKKGYPKFKKKGNDNSFGIPQHIKIEGDKVRIPKFNEGIKFVKHREIIGEIRQCTISQSPSGKYHISILVENGLQEPSKKIVDYNTTVGLDFGIKTLVVASNGMERENKNFEKKGHKKLKKLQRKLAKKNKGSNRRSKARVNLAKQYEKIANQRSNYIHKISYAITHDNQVSSIAIEDLNVSGMIKNGKLSRAISNCSRSMLRTQLEYKSVIYGKNLLTIGRFEASSKLCSGCGEKNKELKLQDRFRTCSCGLIHDRDKNAAENIRRIGIIGA